MKTQARAAWLLIPVMAGSILVASLGAATAPAGRYQTVSDGVADTFTGLVWEAAPASGTLNFTQAAAHCAGLGGSWRLPGMKELLTLVDWGTENPAIDTTFFPGTPSEPFWASSSNAADTSAWVVTFSQGRNFMNAKTMKCRVRCVR